MVETELQFLGISAVIQGISVRSTKNQSLAAYLVCYINKLNEIA